MGTFCDHSPLAFLAGALYALCLPGNAVTLPFPLGLLGVALMLSRPTFLRIALFSLGYCCFAQYWIAHTLQEFGGIPFPWNVLLTGAYSLITLPQYFVFALALKLIQVLPHPFLATTPIPKKYPGIALALTFIEYYCPQQFPHHLGYHWLQIAPELGLAPIGGVPSFPSLVFGSPWDWLHWYRNRRIDLWCAGIRRPFRGPQRPGSSQSLQKRWADLVRTPGSSQYRQLYQNQFWPTHSKKLSRRSYPFPSALPSAPWI